MPNKINLSEVLPKFQCHKVVGSAIISEIQDREAGLVQLDLGDSKMNICLYDHGMTPPQLKSPTFMVGCRLVQYKDGYLSFSPSLAFDEGYAPLEEGVHPMAPVREFCDSAIVHTTGRDTLHAMKITGWSSEYPHVILGVGKDDVPMGISAMQLSEFAHGGIYALKEETDIIGQYAVMLNQQSTHMVLMTKQHLETLMEGAGC